MFARLIEEYGSQEKQKEEPAVDLLQRPSEVAKVVVPEAVQASKDPQGLMQEEERMTGAVSWSVYAGFFAFSGGFVGFTLLVLFTVLAQGAQGECSSCAVQSMEY